MDEQVMKNFGEERINGRSSHNTDPCVSMKYDGEGGYVLQYTRTIGIAVVAIGGVEVTIQCEDPYCGTELDFGFVCNHIDDYTLFMSMVDTVNCELSIKE